MTNGLRICCLVAASAIVTEPVCSFAGSLDQLTDLTGRVQAIVTLKSRDNFTSEYRYDVSVRNLSSDAIIGDSVVIVLDKITNLAGEDREGLTGESFLKRFDVLDHDGPAGEELVIVEIDFRQSEVCDEMVLSRPRSLARHACVRHG